MHTEFTQDPQAKLPITWDWTNLLDGTDTLASATVTAVTDPRADGTPGDLTVGAPTLASPLATAMVSGGTAGKRYALLCHAVTASGAEDEHTVFLLIQNQ